MQVTEDTAVGLLLQVPVTALEYINYMSDIKDGITEKDSGKQVI